MEDEVLGVHELLARQGHLGHNLARDRGDAVTVGMEDVPGPDLDPAYRDRDVDVQRAAVTVG